MGSASRRNLVAALAALASCVSAPRESIELSEVVDRQIAAMQASHESFVRLYYDRLRSDVDAFMRERWIPEFLGIVVSGREEGGQQFRRDLDTAYRLANVDWRSRVSAEGLDEEAKLALERTLQRMLEAENATLGQVLIDFSQAAQAEIDRQRAALLEPIDEQEAFVLGELREGYADLLRGAVAIKAYLASVVDLTEQRDATLAKVGLLDEQRKMVGLAVRASERAAGALRTVESSEEAIDGFFAALGAVGAGSEGDTNP